MARAKRSDTKQAIRERQRAWLHELVKATGKSASQLATGAGVSDTTLTRLLNDEDYDGALSTLTVEKLKAEYKVPGPEEYASPRRSQLLGFSEAERFDPRGQKGPVASVIAAMLEGRNAVDPWRLKTNALEHVGYLPGDIVLVDTNASPTPQDAVCALVHDWVGGRAETVWRVYDPPFLVAAAADRTSYKPLLVDNDRVLVKGVIVESYRPHRLAATK